MKGMEGLVRAGRRDVRLYFCVLSLAATLFWIYVNRNWNWEKNQNSERTPALWRFLSEKSVDLKTVIRAERVTALIQPKRKCNENTKLAISVMSAVGNVAERKAVRDTWGSIAQNHDDIYMAFLVGTTNDTKIQKALEEESGNNSDIIQEDFVDTYDNLTLKTVMMLKWMNHSCNHTQYVLKIDDDMFVNIPNLLAFLNSNVRRRLLVGSLFEGASPDRDPLSKWYSPSFPAKIYPNYVSGTGYVLSGNIVDDLYRAALESQYFRLEDVFLTGLTAKRVNITPVNHPDFHFNHQCPEPCWFSRLITVHRMTIKQLYTVWNNLHSDDFNCDSYVLELWRKFLRWLEYCSYD